MTLGITKISAISNRLHKPRDPYFVAMSQRKKGAHKDKKKVINRKKKHKKIDLYA